MRSFFLVATQVVMLAFFAKGAAAQLPDMPGKERNTVGITLAVEAKQAKKAGRVKPLILPNIGKLSHQMRLADRSTLSAQLIASRRVINFWTHRGKWLRATHHEKCWEVPWQRTCTVARASYRLHETLAKIAEDRLRHEIPLINDWVTAVRYVCTKIYVRPDVCDFLLSVSDREGGWGEWVWYGGRPWSGYHIGNDFLNADTVGGWMQFRYSTFAPYWRGAEKDLRSRGFIIPHIPMPPEGGPAKYAAWLSPIGQALTAGYMKYYGREACHWCL